VRVYNVYTEKQFKQKFSEEPPEEPHFTDNCNVVLGQGTHLLHDHALLGQGFCRKWTDLSGSTRIVFGRIAECSESLSDTKEKLFKVEYGDSLRELAVDMSEIEAPITAVDNVTEMVAWGGYLTYVEDIHGWEAAQDIKRDSPAPFHWKWLVPDTRRVDSQGRLVMEIRGFRLVFEVNQSSIDGADLGLVMTAFCVCGEDRSHFLLAVGELLDMGQYAPLFKRDCKSHHTYEVKNFIHSYEPEVYAFDAKCKAHKVYDITDDKTGQLHEKAAENHLVRVNETNGKDIPSVFAETDPLGAIHYYLGHALAGHGDLKIPVGQPFELTVSLFREPCFRRLARSRLKNETFSHEQCISRLLNVVARERSIMERLTSQFECGKTTLASKGTSCWR
jgi:hypothetical protein